MLRLSVKSYVKLLLHLVRCLMPVSLVNSRFLCVNLQALVL
jgi:hypothetical protein